MNIASTTFMSRISYWAFSSHKDTRAILRLIYTLAAAICTICGYLIEAIYTK